MVKNKKGSVCQYKVTGSELEAENSKIIGIFRQEMTRFE